MSTDSRGDSQSLPAPERVTVTDAISGDRLDFEAESDEQSRSWKRAVHNSALIERASHFGWRVTIVGGSTHTVALCREAGEYIGWCDCKGFRHHDGPCAHLCALRQEAFVNGKTTDGRPISIARAEPEGTEERVADGGWVERAVDQRREGRR